MICARLVFSSTYSLLFDWFLVYLSSEASLYFFFFFKQKTAYEMRISDWSSDVCSSDLAEIPQPGQSQGNLDRPRQAAALDGRADQEGQEGRGFPDQEVIGTNTRENAGSCRRLSFRWRGTALPWEGLSRSHKLPLFSNPESRIPNSRLSQIPPRRQQQVAEQQPGNQREQDIDHRQRRLLAGGEILLLDQRQHAAHAGAAGHHQDDARHAHQRPGPLRPAGIGVARGGQHQRRHEDAGGAAPGIPDNPRDKVTAHRSE